MAEQDDGAERSQEPTQRRLDEARRRLAEAGARALLVGPGADLAHLTGHHALPLERLTMLVLPSGGTPTLVVPRLEEPLAREGLAQAGLGDPRVAVRAWSETEDPLDLVASVLDATLPMADVREAYARMASRRVMGKLVLVNP